MSEQQKNIPEKGKGAVVVGAGIGGIRSALNLAEAGHHVTLIEQSPHMGGILSKLDHQFPTDGCGMCRMLPMIHRDQSSQFCLRRGLFHENIDLMLSTTLDKIQGQAGEYTVRLRQQRQYVDPDLCTGCGECAKICPVEIPDAFNENRGTCKAVHLPLPHAIPKIYTIDMNHCTLCNACVDACPEDAITLPEDQKKKFRIIVVDDELIVRDSVKEWFEFEGYPVDMADSGYTALEMIRNNSYSLMMLDIKMPKMEGTEVLKLAREIDPGLQVVMMTAYATVETAVETMKTGALEYIIKPFDPDTLVEKVNRIYQAGLQSDDNVAEISAGAVIMACGTGYYNPMDGKNTFGYGVLPDVITSLEFERMISGSGTTGGKILRPSNGEIPRRIAWIQCVGSRDIQSGAPYCSSICCMFALKEAVLARKRSSGAIETVIYYMDMRCFGKEFEAYRREAQEKYNVILKRARPHSVRLDSESGKLRIYISGASTVKTDEIFDIAVLSVGQRPAPESRALADLTGMPLNDFGFPETGAIPHITGDMGSKRAIFIGGAFGGLKDISESVIHASAAAAEAMAVLNGLKGTAPSMEPDTALAHDNNSLISHNSMLSRPLPLISAEVNINTRLAAFQGPDNSGSRLMEPVKINNRVLIVGAGIAGMTAALTIAESGYKAILVEKSPEPGGNLKWLDSNIKGDDFILLIAGMKEKIQKHPLIFLYSGWEMVECKGEVGQFTSTIQGIGESSLEGQGTVRNKGDRVESPTDETPPGIGKIQQPPWESNREVIRHGAVIIATGASEAGTTSFAFGKSSSIVTAGTLQRALNGGAKRSSDLFIDPRALKTVVMIQCVDSRDETKGYCSRICCTSSLKHALALKKINPDIQIYILYRDMVSPGFTEKYFNEARQAGIIFIQYSLNEKPRVSVEKLEQEGQEKENQEGLHGQQDVIKIRIHEPIVDQAIEINTDLLVLATGVKSNLFDKFRLSNPSDSPCSASPPDLAQIMGVAMDEYHFFQQADSKWRPVDSTREGVFICGMAMGPRDVEESIASARAAAMEAMGIISHGEIRPSTVTAGVKSSLCSLCLRCVDTCPYEARHLNEENMKIQVNGVICQGCGACAVVCPNSASFINGFTDQQMFEIIDVAMGY